MKTKNTFIALALCTMLFSPLLWRGAGGEAYSQNIGISATGATPDNSAMLDIADTTKGVLIPRLTGTQKCAITSPATGLLIFQTDTVGFWYYDGSKWIPLLSSTSSTSGSTGGWGLSGNGNTSASNFLGTTDNVSLRLRTNDIARVILDSLGRVGIGKTNPAYKLDILDSNSAGSGVISRTLNLYQTRTEANITAVTTAIGITNNLLCRMSEGTPGSQGFGYAANNVAFTDGAYTFNQLRGANNTAYTTSSAAANQNVLMGAANSGYLNSSGNLTSSYGAYNQAYNNSSGTITTAYGTQNYASISTGASGAITNAYGSSNTVGNTSTAGGSITQAVGVSSYIYKAAAASAIPTGYLYFGEYAAGAATTKWGIYLTGETNNYFSGNVGIGTANPSQKLHVVGNICYTGSIGACSDIRYKKQITPLPNALNNVMKLQGVSYYWKTKEFPDKNFTNEKQIGVIAQELERIYPELVVTDKDGYKSVDYSRLTPILVEAIKEQQKMITSMQLAMGNQQIVNNKLKEENQNTKAELAELRTLINKLLQQNTTIEDIQLQIQALKINTSTTTSRE